MKLYCLIFAACAFSFSNAFGDLTIVQKVEGMGPVAQMTMKIKGDKARVDVSPEMTMIFDAKSGDMINLMREQKMVLRTSAAKIRAAAEMMGKSQGKNDSAERPKMVATGKKETLNGYQTEIYTCDAPHFKATYWIATNYPDGAAILRQLQAIKMDALNASNIHMPDYRDFPGVPVKTAIAINGKEVTTMLDSIKQDPLSDAEFAVPADYKEMSLPDIFSRPRTSSPHATP